MKCKLCGEDVRLMLTMAGTKVLINRRSAPLGMLFVNSDNKVQVWTKDTGRSVPRYESHNYNCPSLEAE